MAKIIERPMYLQALEEVKQTPDIKILAGVRRSGKSVILEQFIDHLRNTDPLANIIHINFMIMDFENLRDYHSLENYINKLYDPERHNYVFIDEVQMCKGFELAVNSLHARGLYDIYLTGSNAFLQRSDLSTLFVGRTFTIPVYPFSFQEYLDYFSMKDIDLAFTRFLQEGGFAGSYLYKTEERHIQYINETVDALIVRDIVQKYKVRKDHLLSSLIDFFCSNIGQLTSVSNITKCLKQEHKGITDPTVERYVDYFCNAFLFYPVRRYDIRTKKYLSSNEKYYLVDTGIRYARLGKRDMDYGPILENAVAIELMRRGYELYVGVLFRSEIDFVAMKNGSPIYIQVTNNLSDPSTFKREVSPLIEIKDSYPKVILSRTHQPTYVHEGIHIVDVAEWMGGKVPLYDSVIY